MKYLVFKNNFSKLILLLIPLCIALQSFLPKPIETVIIVLKLIIGPLIVLFYVKRKIDNLWIVIIIGYLGILSLINPPFDFDDFKLVFLSIFSSLSFFLLGKQFAGESGDRYKYKYLTYGVNVFNSISIILYILVFSGVINLIDIYEIVGREGETDLFRFSLGNAIEMPFSITCLLFASIILTRGSKNFIFATLLNLLLAFISQSRIVVIIALLLFFNEFYKINIKNKLIIVFLILIIGIYVFAQIDEIFVSTIERYGGNDSGSKDARLEFYNRFLSGFGIKEFIVGGGLTSSSFLIYKLTRVYGSIESVFLQMIYETGVFITCLMFIPILKSNFKSIVSGRYRLALIFVYIEILFFLPISTSMIATFFLFGVCSKSDM